MFMAVCLIEICGILFANISDPGNCDSEFLFLENCSIWLDCVSDKGLTGLNINLHCVFFIFWMLN